MKSLLVLLGLSGVILSGCHAPGARVAVEERPDEVRDFAVLYKQNCAACHGEQGRGGIAVSLANPVYIAVAGKSAIAKYTDEGGPGALMPAFGRRHGGFLTEEQVNILADGIVRRWGLSGALGSMKAPAYAASQPGDRAAGKTLFENNCQRCHQLSGKQQVRDASGTVRVVGPVTEPEFLALVSDQNLRSTIIAGKPDEGMPDWRGYGAGPLSDQQVTDIVAWLGSERRQPIQNQEKPQGEKP